MFHIRNTAKLHPSPSGPYRFGVVQESVASKLEELAALIRSGHAPVQSLTLDERVTTEDFHMKTLHVTFAEQEPPTRR